MPTETIGSFEKFLNYGPVGFAGLMLVLVIFSMTLQKTSALQASLLKFFMVIGAVCFLAALAAEFFTPVSTHKMSVVVAPNDFGSASNFPKPIIKLNGNRLSGHNFDVSASGTLIIDVTQSVGAFSSVSKEVEEKTEKLDTAIRNVDILSLEVQNKDLALLKANNLSESLIQDISKIRKDKLIPSTQFSTQTLQAIQNKSLEQSRGHN